MYQDQDVQELVFSKYEEAKEKAKKLRKQYGYLPAVYKVKHPKKDRVKYVVVKPNKLKSIRGL